MKIRCTRTFIAKALMIGATLATSVSFTGCGAPGRSATWNAQYSNSNGSSSYTLSGSQANAVRQDGVGPISISMTVKANSRLKIRLIPGRNDKNINGTGYSYSYSKLGMQIILGGQIYETEALSNGLGGPATSFTIDLSNALWGTQACAKNAASTCRNDFTIVFSDIKYDYCQFRGNYGCAMNSPHVNHPWNFKVQVETDDTGSI